MKIFIGADHRGFELKQKIITLLTREGHQVVDKGSYDAETSTDYPLVSYEVASSVAGNKNSRGILVCMTGIGHSIAANKIPGVYAALCYSKDAAVLSRQHNNSNVLVLGAKFVKMDELTDIIDVWLKTRFEGGRHLRRIKEIKAIEKKILSPRKK